MKPRALRAQHGATGQRHVARWPRSAHRLPGVQLTGDESLDHLNGTVCLGARMHNPAVLGAWVDLVVDLATSRPVRRDEVLLHRGEHIVVQFSLQDKHGWEEDGLAALEDALWVGLEN